MKRHPGTFETRGKYRNLILYVGGKRHCFSVTGLDKKASERFARDKMRELQAAHDRKRPDASGETKFSALLEQYQRDELPTLATGTQRSYGNSFVPIRDYFVDELGDPTLEKIGTKHVKAFLAWRRTSRRPGRGQKLVPAPVSNRTLQKDRAVLHRLFDYAYRLELREGNPVSRVEQTKGDPRSPVLLTDDQFEALLRECARSPMLHLYALTLNETGGRCLSEVLHLQWKDVDLTEGFIEIRSGDDGHRTKTGRSRFVPMTERLHTAMRAHFARYRFASYAGSSSPWLFHHEITRRSHIAGARVHSFRTSFDSAAKRAGIPRTFHRHDLRHRRVTSWLAAGANPVHVKEAVGHADLRTTMGYTHLSKQHLRSLVASLPAPPVATERPA